MKLDRSPSMAGVINLSKSKGVETFSSLHVSVGETIVRVDRTILTRGEFPIELVYSIEGSNKSCFRWRLDEEIVTNTHRLVPQESRGQRLGQKIMHDAEKLIASELGESEVGFNAMKTENFGFALAQGYEGGDVERELYEEALAQKREWLHKSYMERVALRLFVRMPTLYKSLT